MHEIAVSDCQQILEIDTQWVRRIVVDVLRHEGVEQAEVSVALVDDPTIHELNRRHLDHDYPTDVLSFPLTDPGAESLEGEIVISTETAVREAAAYHWQPRDELLLYLVHGLLHLCGYDDHDDADRARMRQREAEILQIWDLTPNYQTQRATGERGASSAPLANHQQ